MDKQYRIVIPESVWSEFIRFCKSRNITQRKALNIMLFDYVSHRDDMPDIYQDIYLAAGESTYHTLHLPIRWVDYLKRDLKVESMSGFLRYLLAVSVCKQTINGVEYNMFPGEVYYYQKYGKIRSSVTMK